MRLLISLSPTEKLSGVMSIFLTGMSTSPVLMVPWGMKIPLLVCCIFHDVPCTSHFSSLKASGLSDETASMPVGLRTRSPISTDSFEGTMAGIVFVVITVDNPILLPSSHDVAFEALALNPRNLYTTSLPPGPVMPHLCAARSAALIVTTSFCVLPG